MAKFLASFLLLALMAMSWNSGVNATGIVSKCVNYNNYDDSRTANQVNICADEERQRGRYGGLYCYADYDHYYVCETLGRRDVEDDFRACCKRDGFYFYNQWHK